jgi:ABC-type branched-subunit amino acid transport system ATPase component
VSDSAENQEFSDLTQTLLDEQSTREAETASATERTMHATEELPGVGDESMTLREGLAVGGVSVFGVLGALDAFDALQLAIPSLLGPEIQETFDLSNTGLAVIGIGGLVASTLFAVPMGQLADRVNRMRLIGFATIGWSLALFARGFQAAPLGFLLVGVLIGIGTSNTQPVQGAVLADAYPINARGRVYALKNVLGRGGDRIAPLLVGSLMLIVDDNWRWAYWIFAWPTVALGIWALFVPDPQRGRFEQEAVLGEVMDDDTDAPKVALSAVWQRLMAIKTLKLAWMSFGVIVFALIGQGFLVNLYLDDQFGLSPFQRAMIGFVPGLLSFAAAPWAAKKYDKLYAASPARALGFIGWMFFPMALIIPIQFLMPNPWLFAIVGIVPSVLSVVIFGMAAPIFVGLVPYKLRAQSIALSMVVIFLGGGVLGPIMAGLLSDAVGERAAIIMLSLPFNLLGGAFLLYATRYIEGDLSLVVDELEKEKADRAIMTANPTEIPALMVRDIDFSYGSLQVLFGVDLEVATGETLALLGTNGAGKSTVLRAISGLIVPSRGVVRLHGRDITLTSPQTRVGLGIQQLPGGRGVFQPLTVSDNLRTAGWAIDKTQINGRIDAVLELFGELKDRLDEPAEQLSGGQQQMLALAMVLIHEPDVLLIDELSLGLAPAVVADLLVIVERLRDAGQTMIIVEQSLNIAMAVSDRAIFLEKGQVRFDGSTSELAGSDIARAVFLGEARDTLATTDSLSSVELPETNTSTDDP